MGSKALLFAFGWGAPILSSLVWLSMLLGLLVTWITDGSKKYRYMEKKQTIAYISDIGASNLKPLFIAGSVITVVLLDAVFLLERYLRHTGDLQRNDNRAQKIYSIFSTIFAIAGAAGLILLSIFDTAHHHNLHNAFLAVFIAGYVFSAVFVCLEYWRLEHHHRERKVLRVSFYLKLIFIVVEVALAVAFGVCQKVDKWNASAVLEWIIAFIFTLYDLSFAVDFHPTARSDYVSGSTGIRRRRRKGPEEAESVAF